MKKFILMLLSVTIITIFTACQSDVNSKYNIVDNKYNATETEFATTNIDSESSKNYNKETTDLGIEITNIGDSVKFGNYEQDNNTSNGKEEIEWICINKDDDKALLISKYCLDGQPYNNDFVETSWENSSLRDWLNSSFYEEAFSNNEQSIILTTEVLNSGESNTMDKVSLLSIDEVNEYFHSTDEEIANLTDYAVAELKRNATSRFPDGWSNGWWLRSMSEKYKNCAAHVGESGKIFSRIGANVDFSQGVRPIIWVKLK